MDVRKRKEKEREEKEEKLKQQRELEKRKKKEQQGKNEMLKKEKELEVRKSKELEEHKKEIKVKNDKIKKQQEKEHVRKKSSNSLKNEEVMGTNATQSKNSSTNVVAPKKGKVSFNDMPTDHDHVLSTGSHLRRVCCSCNAPREFSTSKCNLCKGKLVIRYRKVNATVWTQPRMPPNHEGRYVECQDFQNGKCCFKRCNFAHGQDQLEIWELCRVKGKNKRKRKARSSGSTTNNLQNSRSDSRVMKQEEVRCNFCDIKFPSMPELQHHYSSTQHRVNAMKQLHAKSTTEFRSPPDGYKGRYKLCHRFQKGRCYFGNKCTFAHGTEERAYWLTLYESLSQHLAKLRKERLLTESFREKVRRRVKCEGAHVLKKDLHGVTVNCGSPWEVELDGPDSPQTHMWAFDVTMQTKYQLLLKQVAFLLETHLDKFQFLRSPTQDCSLNTESIQFLKKNFVKDSGKQESTVRFWVKFSSGVFGDFKQKLVFDFGRGLVLVRSLFVSVVSKDICSSNEETSSRTAYCCILEWSEEEMELVKCKDMIEMDLVDLCDRYSIPNVLPDPSECTEFTRETYCKLWHDILFIEEQHVLREVARY